LGTKRREQNRSNILKGHAKKSSENYVVDHTNMKSGLSRT
jgi:hypothetical protein